MRGEPIIIGYLGGSITVGEGASDKEVFSWRALTSQWFKEQFPASIIREHNAGIGGTGSDLGTFRCAEDLLQVSPDLVFVEFAVNDGGKEETLVLRSMEGIVRQIRRVFPLTDIIFIYTAVRSWIADGSFLPPSVRVHQAVAAHDGLGSIDVGQALSVYTAGDLARLERCLPDGTHPSDEGHGVYAQAIREYLQQAYASFRPEDAGSAVLPEPLHPQPLEGMLLDAWKVAQPGWCQSGQSL